MKRGVSIKVEARGWQMFAAGSALVFACKVAAADIATQKRGGGLFPAAFNVKAVLIPSWGDEEEKGFGGVSLKALPAALCT